MSVLKIRRALESGLNAITPALSTAWQNDAFVPVTGTPWQRVDILYTEPDNIEFGNVFRQDGFMQVSLFYPLKVGTATAETRAELIRSTFKRGNTYTNSGVDVIVDKTPEITQGRRDDDWWNVNVRIRFFAHITA